MSNIRLNNIIVNLAKLFDLLVDLGLHSLTFIMVLWTSERKLPSVRNISDVPYFIYNNYFNYKITNRLLK